MSIKKNMGIWEHGKETDMQFTKSTVIKKRNITSINPTYQFEKATEIFGPYGLGWGVKIDSETFTETNIDEVILLNYDATLFYKYEGEEGLIPLHATEKMAYKSQKGYMIIDDEARKKVVTNAITKGLSTIGFSADIFKGLYDDREYVEEIATKQQIEKAEDKDAVIKVETEELKDFVVRHKDSLNAAKTLGEAKGLFTESIRHLNNKRKFKYLTNICDRGIVAINEANTEALKRINGESK